MKKSTVKTTNAIISTKPVAEAKKAASKIVKKSAATTVKKSDAPAVKSAPASKKSVVTTITADIDVGFGNTLFVRGEGAGLSWDVGVPLDCVSDSKWSISLPAAKTPVVYKFLINDIVWSAGNDYVVEPGSSAVVVPMF